MAWNIKSWDDFLALLRDLESQGYEYTVERVQDDFSANDTPSVPRWGYWYVRVKR